ncbi:hypothetical protein D3C72_359120 [compost metagenome]
MGRERVIYCDSPPQAVDKGVARLQGLYNGISQASLPIDFGKKEGGMGGVGSGRWQRRGKKEAADHCLAIDVRRWHRRGMLARGWHGRSSWRGPRGEFRGKINVAAIDDGMSLAYIASDPDGVRREFRYRISLTWTACNFGGRRPWFVCPGRGCDRRAAKLFLVNGLFLCRRCHGLAYESQRQDFGSRQLDKAQVIRRRLGGSASLLEPFPWKPKWMHWATYQRLLEEERRASMTSMMAVARRFGMY